MKKMMILAAVLLVGVVVLTGCSSGNGLEGTSWKYTQDVGSYYVFSFSGGTCTASYVNVITGSHETTTAPYRIDGNKITMNGQTDTWKISGNTLVLTENGNTITLERQ